MSILPKARGAARIKCNFETDARGMKVILTQTVPNLGVAGDVKEVKKGYGFNYLLPEGLAELATPGALKSIKHLVARAEHDRHAQATQMAEAIQSVNGKMVTITMKSRDGKLFGSVTKGAIAKALGGVVNEAVIVLEQPIKNLGDYTVTVEGQGVVASIKLSVVSE